MAGDAQNSINVPYSLKTKRDNIFWMKVKGIRLLAPLVGLLVIFGSGAALGAGAGVTGGSSTGDGYFDVGNFCQYGSDGIEGKYALSGLEGCVISVYSADGSHLLDIIYRADHIEMHFQIIDDALLKKLLEKEEWLKDYINELSYKKMTFEKPEISFTYGNCSIEMHDTSINFLRICTTGNIVFSNMSGYNIKNEGNVVELSKGNFSGTVISSHVIKEENGKLIADRYIMFRGTDTTPLPGETEKLRTVDEAIKSGTLGGEITIVRDNNGYRADNISYYGNVTISNRTLTFHKAEFIVSGDDHTTGKTIKINVGKDALSSKNLKVMFDGKEIPLADNLTDVLDPNNDGLQPEYVKVNVTAANGGEFFLLISIPHFSTHTIVLESIAKNPIFIGIAAVCAMAVVVAAAWVMFRKDEATL